MAQTKQIKIKGLHCLSCKTLIENELGALPGVKSVAVDYQSGECLLQLDESKVSLVKIKTTIEGLNYQVALSDSEQPTKPVDQRTGQLNFWLGLSIPLVFFFLLVFYFLWQQFGGFEILSKLNEPKLGYGLIFLIGFLASFHCVGMCGGLVVTYTAGLNTPSDKKTKTVWPHLQYNFGRLISYTVIGGILGGVGSFFAINPYFSGTLMLVAGVFMILMSVSLFTNHRFLNKVRLRTPQFIARYIYRQKTSQNQKSPLIIGLLTGLMPCGPLQAMQLYALGTASFWSGGLSMAFYALGTIPLMLGFGTLMSYLSKKYMNRIMKFSALIVGLLALIMIGRGLANFNFFSVSSENNQPVSNEDSSQIQTARMDLDYGGYQPNILYVKTGIPVRWIINVKQMSGCTNAIVLHGGYNIRKNLQYGENIIEFIPKQSGEIDFSCWMKMVWGKFIVQ